MFRLRRNVLRDASAGPSGRFGMVQPGCATIAAPRSELFRKAQCMTFSTKTAHDIFIILWIERLMHECKTIEYNVVLLMPLRVIALKLSLWGV